jgi:hypothetical protein
LFLQRGTGLQKGAGAPLHLCRLVVYSAWPQHFLAAQDLNNTNMNQAQGIGPASIPCRCFAPPIHFANFQKRHLGIDGTNGRYAEVSVDTCIHCQTQWLHYFLEYEAFPRSGRWFRGPVTEGALAQLTPDKAVAYLEQLDWYLLGGSYFESTGMYGSGKVRADL